MVDIILTTYNRQQLLEMTLKSLLDKIGSHAYRLFIVDDGSDDGTQEYLAGLRLDHLQAVVMNKSRMGVVYSFNMLWHLAEYFDAFHEQFPWMCYMQDDMMVMEEDWVQILIHAYEELGEQYNIGFVSGYDAPEHPPEHRLIWNGREVLIKKSQTASNLMAEKTFWRSIGYVPKSNPDGSVRGMPSHNRGSNIDVYLTGCQSGARFVPFAAAENCSLRQGKTVMVVPGLLTHMAHNRGSTWR